jgi:hypothetical protein
VTKISHIFELAGGLGNQLFQISAAHFFTEEPKFDIAMLRPPMVHHPINLNGLVNPENLVDFAEVEGHTNWRIRNALFTRLAKLSNSGRVGSRVLVQDNEVSYLALTQLLQDSNRSMRIRGYFQDKRFVSAAQIEEFRSKILDFSTINLVRIKDSRPFTAVHYRLGDYLTLNRNLPLTYFEKAFEQLHEQGCLQKTVLVFSDDIVRATNLIGELGKKFKIQIEPLMTTNPREMIAGFGLANSAVISNSTLAWWATKFSKNIEKVVSPADWRDGSDKSNLLDSEWILIDE